MSVDLAKYPWPWSPSIKERKAPEYVARHGTYEDSNPEKKDELCHRCNVIKLKKDMGRLRCPDWCKCSIDNGYGQYNWRCNKSKGCSDYG